MKAIVCWVFIGLVVMAFIFMSTDNKKGFNILKTVVCFACAVASLILAIVAEAYLVILATVVFVVLGVVCLRNLDDDI